MKQYSFLALLWLPFTQALPALELNTAALSKTWPSPARRAATVVPRQTRYTAVPNGEFWYDTHGNPINNYGGGFLKVDSWYYWVGQAMSTGLPPYSQALVNMYKSQDLLNWEYVAPVINVYTADTNGNHILTYCQVQRPKLLYNARAKKYVLWAHWEMMANYDASHVFVATADNVEGPYTVTSKGHFRPGAGSQTPDAMGDRVGGLKLDTGSSAKNITNTTRPYQPISGSDYPPKAQQYQNINPSSPQTVAYLSQSAGYGVVQLSNVLWDLTLKVVAVQMTQWDTLYYAKYSPYFSISSNNYNYLIRYPTANRSEVLTRVFTIGNSDRERATLVAPDIGPGLDESSSSSTVFVHSGDAAFVTCNTAGGAMYYTTNDLLPTANGTQYYTGTRISITGLPGNTLTVKAICTLNGKSSPVVSQTYTIVDNTTAVPIFRPIVSIPSGTYAANESAFGDQSMKIYCPTYNTECYYTTDGVAPSPPMLGANIGYGSRDLTVWQDPKDGSAYLFSATDNVYNRVWLLTEDFTDVVAEKEYDVFTQESREAPTLVRHGGAAGKFVYLITSTQSGWFPNQGQYVRTNDVTAGFKLPRDPITGYRNGNSTWSAMEPVGDPSTYYSQSTFIINIGSAEKPQYIFVGDRYNTVDLVESTYVFIPLTINDTAPAVTGDTGTGLMTLQYVPSLQLSVPNSSITPPLWKLLSLNKPVNATDSTQLTADQVAAGTYKYSADAANDGVDYDVSPWDSIQLYYKPVAVPFYWQVDLGQVYNLAWIGLSFMSVGGSDAVNRYVVSCSVDGSSWSQLVNNTGNLNPGFMAHVLSGRYRYVRLNDYSVWDIDHGKEADWEVGVYEISVYGFEPGPPNSTATSVPT